MIIFKKFFNKRTMPIVIVFILFFSSIFYLHRQQNRKIVLQVGVFAGSNWEVPSGDSYKLIDEAIARFEKKYPNVEVVYKSGILKSDYSTWLSDKFLKGEEPDVFIVLGEDFNTLSSLGALKDLTELEKEDIDFDENAYYKSALNTGKYQGKQYALPYESNPTLMFVNKTLLNKEGIAIPDNNWSLDDFYRICSQVTKDSNNDGVIDQYGCYNFTWLDSVYSHGAVLFNDEGTESFLSKKEVKDSIYFVRKLNELNKGHTITSEEFDTGKVAFAPMSYAQYRVYKPYPWRVKKYTTFEWDCVKMPSISPDKNMSEVSSVLMAISSRTNHAHIAWEFLKMLTYNEQSQREIFKYSQGISPLKSVMQSPDVLLLLNSNEAGNIQVDLSLLNKVMEKTVNHSQFRKYESALSLIDTRIEHIIQNNEELDISLMDLQQEINKYLQE